MPSSEPGEPSATQSILDELPIGVWVARAPSGELVYANRAFAEITGGPARGDVRAGQYARGYRLRTTEGQPYPEDRLPFCQALAHRIPVVVDDIVVERPDGRGVHVRAWGKPLFDAAGELRLVVVVFLDITAEAEATAKGAAIQEKLQLALQHAPIIFHATDREGIVTVSEGAGLTRMGLQPGELVGRSLHELYRDDPRVLENNRRALAGETFKVLADLGNVVLETWLSPMRGPDGEIRGVIGVSTDVTDLLRMQKQMDQAERLAPLGRLAASVAHEINNPLAYADEALRLAAELVERPGDLDRARLAELLRDARDGANRVRLITGDLKAFSRADDDVRRPQALDKALGAAAKMAATRTGMRARVDIGPAPRVFVAADENRLVQVFVNLLLNAADALPPDTADRNRISVTSRLDGGRVVIEVSDNGPGIPAALRDRVFDPFFTTKPVGEGTGLGLFVTRNIVQTLGGSIALADAPGGGALFSIGLPVVPAPPGLTAETVAAPESTARAVAVAARPPRARVLIIDDEPQLRRLFRAALEPDYDVEVLPGGRAALAHVLQGPAYDLVLCDLMMAEISGMKLFEEVQHVRPGLEQAFVFMTGGVFDPRVADFLASIDNPYIDKPFDVRAEVARHLRRHSPHLAPV